MLCLGTAIAMRSHLDALSMVAGLEMGLTVWITAFIVMISAVSIIQAAEAPAGPRCNLLFSALAKRPASSADDPTSSPTAAGHTAADVARRSG